MATSFTLQNDPALPQGYLKVDGSTSATFTTTGITGNLTGTATDAASGSQLALKSAKAWVNFNGAVIFASFAAPSGTSLSVTSGSNIGVWTSTGFNSGNVGMIYFINIGGTNATLGGVNVSTVGIQITNIISSTQANFILLAGNATSSQTVNGNGTSSGFQISTSGIRSSYNVSSITKNATGDYSVNFTTAMADANYSAAFMGGDSQTTNTGTWGSPYLTKTTSQFRFQTTTWSSNRILWDVDNSSVQIFGN